MQQTKQKKKKITVADILRAVRNQKENRNFDKFNEFFPRTIDSVKPIDATGKTVAEDSIDKASFQNMIPEAVMDYLNDAFIGYQACSLLKQNAFIDRACTIPAKDAIAPDFKISYQNKKDDAADELTENVDELADIQNSVKKFNVKNICIKQNQNKKVYGYSITIPIVENADMSKPFNIDGIKPGSYKGLSVIEPYWLTPELDYESARNPASKYYFTPTWYNIQGAGVKIHRSWVIRSVNSEVADILKPTYFFGGIPLTQQIFKRVFAAEKVANEAPMLAMTKRLLVVDANIMNMVANPEQVSETMNALTELRDNWGVYAKNPGDQVQQIDTSLADFDALIMTQYQLIASIAGMPATKLLKTTPKGFNATGEYEQKDYNQALIEIQENDFIPILDLHFKLYTKSRYGRAIPLNIVFNPIDTPSEKEIAEIANTKAMIAMTHINAGITTATEERQILRNEEGSPYSGIDEDIQEPELPPDLLDDADNDGGTESPSNVITTGKKPVAEGAMESPSLAATNDAAIDGWITIKNDHDDEEEKGHHLFVGENETPKQAIERAYGIKLKDRGEKQNKAETAKPAETKAEPAKAPEAKQETPAAPVENIKEKQKRVNAEKKQIEKQYKPFERLYRSVFMESGITENLKTDANGEIVKKDGYPILSDKITNEIKQSDKQLLSSYGFIEKENGVFENADGVKILLKDETMEKNPADFDYVISYTNKDILSRTKDKDFIDELKYIKEKESYKKVLKEHSETAKKTDNIPLDKMKEKALFVLNGYEDRLSPSRFEYLKNNIENSKNVLELEDLITRNASFAMLKDIRAEAAADLNRQADK